MGGYAVESVEADEFEKDQAKAIVSYKAGGFTGRVGLSYRRADGFWKLEGAVDLGLK